MVFIVNSNEHTQKVCLSSRLAENYPSAKPKFMFRTPIKAPWNVVSMVCLESAILQAPSLFTPNILNDATNQFKRYVTIDAASGFTDTVQDYWRTDNAAMIGTDTNFQTNIQPIQKLFLTTVNANMSNLEMVGKFFCSFLRETKAFRKYLGPYTVDAAGNPVYNTNPNDT